MTKSRALFFVSALIALLVSCKKKTPEDIGLPLLPQQDLLNAQFTDTATLFARTVKDDSVYTQNTYPVLLGNINDPLFGISRASVYTQIALSQLNPSFGSNPVLDSAVLSLVYSLSNGKGQYYGTLNSQHFAVYELSEGMGDSAYHSNKKIPYYATQQIGYADLIPDAVDSPKVDTIKEPPQLRIRLSAGLFQHFLTDPVYTSTYNANAALQSVFKGMYIVSSTTPASGQGAVLYLNLTDAYSRVTLFYHNDHTSDTSYYFGMSGDCVRFSHFEHDYSGASDISAQINSTSTTVSFDKVYVQAMAGVRSKITMPYLMDFFKAKKVAINKAELILPVDAADTLGYSTCPKLMAAAADSVKGPLILPDYYEGLDYFGGTYDAANHLYKFNIARYIQQVLTGYRTNQGLYIISAARYNTANRVSLFGGKKNLSSRMRLKISYTPLK